MQLLLDEQRYGLVRAEASRSGRSVAAVIREAIDYRFLGSGERGAALEVWLDLTRRPTGPAEDWSEIKAGIEDDLAGGTR
ncbi:MAG: hypothetical protein R2719_12080 [Micropruina sp.]